MDWEKVRLFYEVAQAGNFTRAGAKLGLNQSSISRMIAALERDLKVKLFHRHARGLILTEHGDVLFRSARDVWQRLEATHAHLTDTKERPSGYLKVTATVGLGGTWLARRISEFLDLYPEIQIELILTNDELDLAMREADIAIRLRQPIQADLIQRRLFTVQYYPYAARSYLEQVGEPKGIEDLDRHRIVCLGGHQPDYILEMHQLISLGRDSNNPREPHLVVNDSMALKHALQTGAGVGMASAYAMQGAPGIVRILRDLDWPHLDTYLVYPEEMRSVARLQVFRDFLVMKARSWAY
ncbi:LysR family transcriptional regulator [Microvirga sp. VF16]|uniref:LysR family transcriptional regulator n=1 Tax=Microvirga sp. VF16 TaxID=2807101 RepID=UPI00193D700D|nr:LysR family transcriptional regulator [Microvirga sp. VF16]QRM32463.1 LysR family transcriptional regulator [Microvirga sp. VF16]